MDKVHPPIRNAMETTRRGFFKLVTGILALLCGTVLALPLIGSFIGPSFRKKEPRWIRVADISALPVGTPVDLRAVALKEDAYIRETAVYHMWIVRHSPGEAIVYSPVCPHLGCHYDWDARSSRFRCPCHESVYALDGSVLGGPAPRPLDTLPARIENGVLYVEWKQFKSGTPEKVPA